MPSGGKREGAGRKPKPTKALADAIAKSLFKSFGGESKAWEYLATQAKAEDPRLVFDILRYWTDRKYGKPVQAQEVTGADGNVIRVVVEHIGPANQASAQAE